MNGAVREGLGERVVDEPMLLDERKAVEAFALHRYLEVVAAPGAVGDGELVRVRKCLPEKVLQGVAGHCPIVVFR